MGIRLRPLLSGRIELADLVLDEPTIALASDERGRWNWTSIGAVAQAPAGAPRSGGRMVTAAPASVFLSRISIVDGRLQYRRHGTKSAELGLEKVNVTVSQAAPRAALRLQGDAVVQPGNVRLAIREASLAPSGARGISEMALRAMVDVDAPDVGPLAATIVHLPAVAGAMKGQLEISGTPARIAATGAVGFDGLALSEERAHCEPRGRRLPISDLRIPVALAGSQLESAPVVARMANGTVTLRLSVTIGPTPLVALKDIDVKGVELAPILVDFLCLPSAVTGPMDLTSEVSMLATDPWRTASGSGRFRIGAGRVTGRDVVRLVNDVIALADVGSAVLSSERRARESVPLDFASITGTYRIVSGVVMTDDLLYQGPDLRVTGKGTVTLVNGRVEMAVIVTQGRNQVRGLVSGTTETLRVVPTEIRVPDLRGARRFLDTLYR
jgi:AsmA protein